MQALLAMAQIHRDAADQSARGPLIALDYANADHLRLYGYEVGGRNVGVIGIQPDGENKAIVRDLAVAPDARKRGIGRALIDYLRDDQGFVELEGDTLAPAVAFYERCGFTVRENGRMPDGGTTRYRFSWNVDGRP